MTILNKNYYSKIHKWLAYNFGKADKCENPECLGKSLRYEWALKKGLVYEKNRDNFWMLCRKCHARYDNLSRNLKKFSELDIRIQNRLRKEASQRMLNKPLKYWLGKKMSVEHKKKLSEIAKDNGFGLWMIGKHPTSETLLKKSLSMKQMWIKKKLNQVNNIYAGVA